MAGKLRLLPMIRTLKVLDKQGRLVPLEPNWAQLELIAAVEEDYNAGRPGRYIICKARQLGISTIVEAIIFCLSVIFERSESVVASLDTEQAEYLHGITRRYYDEGPWRFEFPDEYKSKRELAFRNNKSSIKVKTGENPKSLRGRTYRAAHLSEIAFWTQPHEAMLAINQGMPPIAGNFQFIESTSNGIGNFFEEAWNDAVEGRSAYRPFFFPWFRHYEYIPCHGLQCHDGTCKTCEAAAAGLGTLDKEERRLSKLGASRASLAWRRWAVPNRTLNNTDLFKQEFPATAEESFLAAGVNAFPDPLLKQVFEPQQAAVGNFIVVGGEVKFVADIDGAWRLYKHPDTHTIKGDFRTEYFLGADPSFGTVDGDFSAAHIINRRTKEQVAVFHGKVNPIAFAEELAKAGKYYNTCVIACEEEGGGLSTIERLRHIYPKQWMWRSFSSQLGTDIKPNSLGWMTNWKTKAAMILKLMEVIERGSITIHDEATYKELRVYQYYGASGFVDRFGPADKDKGHDDLVMSLAITIVCEDQEYPLDAYEVAAPPPEFAEL